MYITILVVYHEEWVEIMKWIFLVKEIASDA